MDTGLQIRTLDGTQAKNYLQDLARLRITVFREFPYLYDGSLAYEKKYLETYFASQGSRVVMCFDGDQLVGASTVVPLTDESEAFQLPFVHHGHAPEEVMYFGESVLIPEYRGRGVGKRFFEERLKHAAATEGIKMAAFCAVVRPDYRSPLSKLWQAFGFEMEKGLVCRLSWKQIDEAHESLKTLQFWVKEL